VAQRPFLSTATRDGSQPPPLALVAPGGGAAGTPASAATATKACAGVRFGPGTLLPLPYKESSWPEDHLPRNDATRATRRGAPTSASTGGEGVAMARPGCGRPALAFTSTCYTSPRHHGRLTAQDTFSHGGSPRNSAASAGSPVPRPGRLPRKLLSTAVDHGPGSALGCAGSANVFSL
jgi:hypothetical protein